ncbi:PQQ-binding-like beta-propeller repeat protein [Hyphomicrobium sp. xq]|uniref:PQQ-binding-like beta-propeller repeat protein n=1 Tax=Hyphomicrobium album TaxID=2665159 RepID=A0A6I3KLK5_9HYPH|nr:PQQ-binding-like beta-propeller repeat protein [Hyphomicrobium album]MTD95253.1 PQQ-binding-like beta-propeller repeat protein [Hyphomicrobium album]
MHFRSHRRLSFAGLWLFATLPLAQADDFALLNTAKPEVQQQLGTVLPGFLAAQKNAVRANYPLFIFVPGIIGSRLERTTPNGSNVLWGLYDTSTPDLSILDGDDGAVRATILYDFKLGNVHEVDAYASGIQEIKNAQLGVDLLAYFPYDWRQDNGRTAEKLNDWLCDTKQYDQFKDREIRFIAHSMGGLVVKEWFRRYGGMPSCRVEGANAPQPKPLNIKEVIFLGTPHFGAPKAIKSLASGFTLMAKSFGGMLGLLKDRLDKGTVAKALNDYGALFPSVYQLLPIYHEHTADCMSHYTMPPDDWPPHIADIGGSGDKFSIFDAKAWEEMGWPATKPPSRTTKEFYGFLAETLPKARAFLCRLAQYKFPANVKVKYFASNSEKTDASFEITKKSTWWGWLPWSTPVWVIEDVARPPWTEGDGTVPMFVGRNALARGFTQLEDGDATERHECRISHSSLLNCTAFATYIRDVITIAKRAQADAATAYLDSHASEKDAVLQTLASANVYLDCRLKTFESGKGPEFSGCPVNDEIRERQGVDVKTLLAQATIAPPADDKAAKVELVASMKGLEPATRIDAAESGALASIEARKLNEGRNTLVALAGPMTGGDAFAPLQVDDKVIVSMPLTNKVVAVNLDQSPSVAWTHVAQQDPTVIPVMCCDEPNSGRLAYADGKVIKYESDTTLIALDAKTGKELWKTRTGDPQKGQVGDRLPYVVDDQVMVSVSGAEFGTRDYMTSLDVKTGKQNWRAYSRGPDDQILFNPETTMAEGKPVGRDSSLKTWTGDQWKISGGKQLSKAVFDPALKLMYYVASESAPFQPQARSPLASRTIFARAIDTGEAKWIYRLPASSEWDEAGSAELTLSEKSVKGGKRKVVDYLDAAGNLFSLDRTNGELLETMKIKASTMSREQKNPFEIDPSQLR